jgi:hypothetical protein
MAQSPTPAAPAPEGPIHHPPLKGGQLAVATIVVALATFMTVLDTSIANVAIPTEQASVNNPLFNQQIDSTQSVLQLDTQSAHALFDADVNTQAAVMGLDDFFYISTFIFILMIPLIWITRPVKGEGGGDAAAGAH